MSEPPKRPKFAFKQRAQPVVAVVDASPETEAATRTAEPSTKLEDTLVHRSDLAPGDSATLSNAYRCFFALQDASSMHTVYCTGLDGCTVVLPRSGLSGSLFVEGCRDCVFVGTAHQVTSSSTCYEPSV